MCIRDRTARGEDPHKRWSDLSPGDGKVLIVDGELLAGIADKKLLGTGGGSLIHILVNEKKHEITRQFFGAVQKVVNYWLLQRTFSCGAGDTVGDLATCEEVKNVLEVQQEKVHELVQKAQRTIPGKKGKDDLTIQPGKSLQETFAGRSAAQRLGLFLGLLEQLPFGRPQGDDIAPQAHGADNLGHDIPSLY